MTGAWCGCCVVEVALALASVVPLALGVVELVGLFNGTVDEDEVVELLVRPLLLIAAPVEAACSLTMPLM